MNIVFADLAHRTFRPLSLARSVVDIEVGGATIGTHATDRYPVGEPVAVFVPAYLHEITRQNNELYAFDRRVISQIPAETIVADPAVLPTEGITSALKALSTGEVLVQDGSVVALRLDRDVAQFAVLEELTTAYDPQELEEPVRDLSYPWDLDEANSKLLHAKIASLTAGSLTQATGSPEIIGDPDAVSAGDAEIASDVVLDTTDGPIHLSDGVTLYPNTRIEGPVYIGSDTLVGAGENAVIHGPVHIGDVCRVGGEVENAILHSFSNKYHFGFLGHSVLGSWVNVGAGTTNSDLKNTYGTVSVTHPVEGSIEAGTKVGTTIGDHTNTGIHTAIHTGKQIGVCSSLIGRISEDVAPFTWMEADETDAYDPARAVEHMERMVSRRTEYLPAGYIETQRDLITTLADQFAATE